MNGNITALCVTSSTTVELRGLALFMRSCLMNTKGNACVDCSDRFMALQGTFKDAKAAADGDLCFDVEDAVIFFQRKNRHPHLCVCGENQ